MQQTMAGQRGSAAFTIILVLIAAYAAFLGIQYVPIKVEASSMDSILDSLVASQKASPARDASAVSTKIESSLYVNQMSDMKKHFDIYEQRGEVTVTVKYERELNMGYGTRIVRYDKSISLK